MSGKLHIGDRVRVYWENIPWIEGELLYIPAGPGDCWIIRSDDGAEHRVMVFGRITEVLRKIP